MDQNAAVEFARSLVAAIAPDGLRMALLTGSTARGLADDRSDIDIYLYCDPLDHSPPDLHLYDGLDAQPAFQLSTPTGWFAKVERDGRYVDIEAVETSELSRVVASLSRPEAPSAQDVKVAAGLRDAFAVVGASELAEWNERIVFTDEAAAADVAVRCGRLLSPVALFELTMERDDPVSFGARISRLTLDTVALLGAANRRFIPVDDPKWIPWHLAQLGARPQRLEEVARRAVVTPTIDAMHDLTDVIHETLDLVEAMVPHADTRVARYAMTLRPRPSP